MMKVFCVTISLLFSILLFGQVPVNDPHWQMAWEDNFNEFNSNIWVKANDCRHGKDEPQLYLEENVWTNHGNLIIRINDSSVFCQHQYSPGCICMSCDNILYKYTSGWVETKNPFVNRYGYIESRMAIPYRRGLWPAFWTFTSGAGQNACEIDIFEMYGCKGSDHIVTNIHRVYDHAAPYDTATMYLQEDDLNNFSYTDWHIYAMEWDPNKIIWYVDNMPIRLMYNHGITGSVKLILNVAAQETKKCALPTGLPINDSMFVDYIRTYRLKCDNQTVVTEIPDFSLYECSVKKSITLGSGTTIPLSSDISLRATDFIELLPDFEVPAGCELYLDVSPCSNTVP